jgi:hypothetical protein
MDRTPIATCNVSYLLSLEWNFAGDHIANYYVLRLCDAAQFYVVDWRSRRGVAKRTSCKGTDVVPQ